MYFTPDLYIPSLSLILPLLSAHADIPPGMALITYILATLWSGLQAHFNASHLNPEILGVMASAALAVVLMEFAFIQLWLLLPLYPGSGPDHQSHRIWWIHICWVCVTLLT